MQIFHNANYDFIKWRWHALIISLVIIWAGVATIFMRGGLPLGIDFTGGTSVTLEFEPSVNEDVVRQALGPLGADAVVQRIVNGTRNEIMIRLPQTGTDANLDEGATRIDAALAAAKV